MRLPGLAANLAFTLRQPTAATSPLGSTCDSALWFGADDGASFFTQLVQPGELLSTRPFYNVSQCRASSFRPMGSVVWLRLANVKAGFALSISTCSGPQLVADTDLSIFAGPCDRLAQIACNGDSRPAAQCQLGHSSISELPIADERYYIVIGGRQGESLPPVSLTAAYDSPPPPPSMLYSVGDRSWHGVLPQVVTMQWPAGTAAQRYRLVQTGGASLFWLAAWRFFSDAKCTAQIFPENAHDSSHFGCCGTGCIAGVEIGACCDCDHFYRSQPCASEECWVEVDFGVSMAFPCMEYAVSSGSGSGVTLQVWSAGLQKWLDPGVSALEDPRAASSLSLLLQQAVLQSETNVDPFHPARSLVAKGDGAIEQELRCADVIDKTSDTDAFISWCTFAIGARFSGFIHHNFTWSDQGGGGYKGQIILEAYRNNALVGRSNLFGRAPHAPETVTHEASVEDIFNMPNLVLTEGDQISYSYSPGGGGGHALFVRNFIVVLSTEEQDTGPACASGEEPHPAPILASSDANAPKSFAALRAPPCVDGGPWACVEPGCPALPVTCAALAESCAARFESIWTVLPDPRLLGVAVRDECPDTCGLCAESLLPERNPDPVLPI